MLITGADIAGVMNSYALPAFRIFAVFSIAPVLGTRIVPMRVRLVIAIAVGIAVIPLVAQTREVPAEFMAVVPEVVMELVIGLAIGFALRLVFAAIELGAQVISLQMGLGFAELIDPQGGASVPTLNQFYVMLSTLMFLALNGHHMLIELLAQSFIWLPIGADGITGQGLQTVVGFGAKVFQGAVAVALTATVAMVSVNLLVGVMNRAIPQFNMFIAFPGTILLGLMVIAFSLSGLMTQLKMLTDAALTMLRFGVLEGGV